MHLVVISDFGGLGDDISRMPALKHLMEDLRPNLTCDLFVKDYTVELWKVVVDQWQAKDKLTVRPMSSLEEFTEENRGRYPTIGFRPEEIISLHMHLVEHAWLKLTQDTLLNEREGLLKASYCQVPVEVLPKHKMQPEGFYAVLNVNQTAYVKYWKRESIDEVAAWLRGEGILPVFVGASVGNGYGNLPENMREAYTDSRYKPETCEFDASLGLDLRGQTTLLETLRLIQGAKVFVGVEGGLMHLAGMTNTPIVAGFTFRSPQATLPIRKGVVGYGSVAVEPDKDLGCRFCQTNMRFMYQHDFRECYYKDFKCVDQMHGHKFIGALRQILKPGSSGARQA